MKLSFEVLHVIFFTLCFVFELCFNQMNELQIWFEHAHGYFSRIILKNFTLLSELGKKENEKKKQSQIPFVLRVTLSMKLCKRWHKHNGHN